MRLLLIYHANIRWEAFGRFQGFAWEFGGKGEALDGGKYKGKWRNLSYFLNDRIFLENDIINIFLILRI